MLFLGIWLKREIGDEILVLGKMRDWILVIYGNILIY